jgi:hypothetical protein
MRIFETTKMKISSLWANIYVLRSFFQNINPPEAAGENPDHLEKPHIGQKVGVVLGFL